jgi:hypothetical protein
LSSDLYETLKKFPTRDFILSVGLDLTLKAYFDFWFAILDPITTQKGLENGIEDIEKHVKFTFELFLARHLHFFKEEALKKINKK